MRQNLSDRPRGSDKADQPNVTTTAGTCQRKLLTHARQQFRPGNPRRVMVAGHFIKTSSRPAAAAPDRSRDTGTFAGIRFPLCADVPDGKRRDGLPQGMVRCEHPVIPMPVLSGRWNQGCQPVQKLKRAQVDNTTRPGPR